MENATYDIDNQSYEQKIVRTERRNNDANNSNNTNCNTTKYADNVKDNDSNNSIVHEMNNLVIKKAHINAQIKADIIRKNYLKLQPDYNSTYRDQCFEIIEEETQSSISQIKAINKLHKSLDASRKFKCENDKKMNELLQNNVKLIEQRKVILDTSNKLLDKESILKYILHSLLTISDVNKSDTEFIDETMNSFI